MRSLSLRVLFLSLLTLAAIPLFGHDVTISGTQSFASLDGSSSDHDGTANGVFTVSDGNLVVNGTVNCNDDGASTSACAMAFSVSGDMTVNAGGALYAENRSGGGTGGAITLTVGGNLALNGNAIISTASKSSSGATGGAIAATVSGGVSLASGSTIDSGSANAQGGSITVAAGGAISIDGNVLSGPSRTILATRLTGLALDGGSANQAGGAITIGSNSFAEPGVLIGTNANVISQGGDNGAGPITIDGCGIQVRGLVAALSRKDSAAKVSIRSGKDLLVDGRDLGGSGTRMGRVRADAPSGTALNKGVDLFATETIDVLGPASGSLYLITSLPGLHDSKSYGGLIRIISLEDAVNGSGNLIDDGHTASGDTGGTVEISAKSNVTLTTAVIRAHGDFNTGNNNRGGGSVSVRSYSGNVVWTNGTGDVRPVGSTSGLPPADQGQITLTACGTVNTTGTSFPTNGTPTGVFPVVQTGVCSPAAPSLPSGVPPLITCNTPPVANDANASTLEDTTVTITLSGTDADGDSLTFSIVSGPSNGVLNNLQSTGPTTATVDYTPNLNYFGGDSFVFQANDGNGGTDNGTVTITVTPVNDPPTFLVGVTISVPEDAGPQTYTNWVTAISPGPANESGQNVTFTVTNDNNALFLVQPQVDANGTLTFTPAANVSGTANLSVVAQDDGGTANGGDDTSNPQSSSITVTPVNDEPSFTGGGNVTVNEDSGAYSAPWATSISAGPNEGGQTLTFNVSNDNNSLFSVQPAIAADGTLTFTPAGDEFGSATVTVTLSDNGGTASGGDDTSAPQTFTITVNAVNDEPSFTGGADVTVNEDSGPYSAAWATNISAGAANESSQVLTFNVLSNSNPSLFASGPAISSTGVLSFTPAANAFGSATIVVNLTDDGGTANGGDNTSASDTFTITVNAVNDAPSFTPGGDVTVNEDSGPYLAPWATSISAGPNESGQTVTFLVSNDNNSLFAVQPSITSTGVLSFTPALNANGSALVTVTLQDNGGTANGGVATSGPVTFTIFVTAVNDAPTAGADSWETLGNTELRVDLAGGLTPKIVDTTPSGTGVRHNDSDPEGDPHIVTGIVGCSDVTAPFDCTLGDGSKVSMLANGSFSYTPGPGNTSGSFQYTITDIPSAGSPSTAVGTVTIIIHDMIWYVNGSAIAGGNGTSIAPFSSFASLNGAGGVGDDDAAGSTIFVHTSLVTGTLGAEANQKIWGEGFGLSTNLNLNGNGSPQVLVAPGVKPSVIGGGDTITVAGVTGVDIAGLALTSSSGNGIDVTSAMAGPATGASIHDNTIVGAAQEGIDVNADSASGTTVLVNNTSITSAGNGFDVSSGGPAVVSYTNGTILSTGGTGVRMDGTISANLTVSGFGNVTIDGGTAGDGISINTAKFDAVPGGAFNVVSAGTVTVGSSLNAVGGAGVVMTNVSGDLAFGTLSVFGGTSGVTIAGSGLFTGAAGMRVTSGGGAISAPAGVGLSVTAATIGAAHLNFTSITATGGSTGITLNNTGTSGGLVVSGTGAANSGGTINGVPIGVSLTSTAATSLSWMNLNNFGDFAIRGTTVNGFTLNNSTISGVNGNNGALDEGSVSFTNLTGSATVSNTSISGGFEDNFKVVNNTGTLNRITFSSVTIGANSTAGGNDGIQLEAQGGGAVINATIQNSFFTSARGDLLDVIAQAGTTADVDILGNAFSNNHPAIVSGGGGVTVHGQGNITFDIRNNTFRGARGRALNVSKGAISGVFSGTIDNNGIGVTGIANSGSLESSGIFVDGAGAGSMTVAITRNTVRRTNEAGIYVLANNQAVAGNNATLHATITGNVVAEPGPFSFAGLFVDIGATPADASFACVDVGGAGSLANDFSTGDPSDFSDISLSQIGNATVRLPGYGGTPFDTTAIETYLKNRNANPSATAVSVSPGSVGFVGGAACLQP